MSATNEDFLFAQEAQNLGYVTEEQVEEGFLLQRRKILRRCCSLPNLGRNLGLRRKHLGDLLGHGAARHGGGAQRNAEPDRDHEKAAQNAKVWRIP